MAERVSRRGVLGRKCGRIAVARSSIGSSRWRARKGAPAAALRQKDRKGFRSMGPPRMRITRNRFNQSDVLHGTDRWLVLRGVNATRSAPLRYGGPLFGREEKGRLVGCSAHSGHFTPLHADALAEVLVAGIRKRMRFAAVAGAPFIRIRSP